MDLMHMMEDAFFVFFVFLFDLFVSSGTATGLALALDILPT